jgi:hypothetical protein
MSRTNPDNRLKCDVSGYKGWMPMKFGMGKGPDGKMRTVEGFKNVLTDQEVTPEGGHNAAPPCPTGDIAICRHNSEGYRRNYDLIVWDKDKPHAQNA